MEQKFTIDELIMALPKIISYIGKDRLLQIIKDENPVEKQPDEKTPDEILAEINNFKR